MASLFIDSTYDITIGILGDANEWRQFERFTGQKASTVLQTQAYQMLNSSGLEIKDLESVVTIAGPGFYTGLRLSEGFADVTAFFGIPHFSFYSYDIPKFTGIESGVWMTKAYRGEYFFHHWGQNQDGNHLVPLAELENYLEHVDKSQFYIHSGSAIDDHVRKHVTSWHTTHELLQNKSQLIFPIVKSQKLKLESFYFRAPEDEFRVSV